MQYARPVTHKDGGGSIGQSWISRMALAYSPLEVTRHKSIKSLTLIQNNKANK